MLVLLKVCKSVHKFQIICLSERQVDLNFYLMIAIWKFQDIILCVLIIRQIKTWSSLYILQELFDFKNHRHQLFNKCVRLELLVGASSLHYTDLQVNREINLNHLKKTASQILSSAK